MRRAAGWIRIVTAAALLVCVPALARADHILGSGERRILGLRSARLEVSAPPEVPIQTAFSLPTRLVNSDAALFGGRTLLVQGDLTGPGVCEGAQAGTPGPLGTTCRAAGVLELKAIKPGDALVIPPLARAGNYEVSRLRLTNDLGIDILPATPSVISIKATDQILITSVTSRPLSLTEIQDRGIVLNDSNFTAYECRSNLSVNGGLRASSPSSPSSSWNGTSAVPTCA